MSIRVIEIPDTAIEVDGYSATDVLKKIYKIRDKLISKGKDAVVVNAKDMRHYPAHTCTHFITSPLVTLVLLVKEWGE